MTAALTTSERSDIAEEATKARNEYDAAFAQWSAVVARERLLTDERRYRDADGIETELWVTVGNTKRFDTVAIVLAEQEISEAKVSAARRLRAAEEARRPAVMVEANEKLELLSVEYGQAEQAVRACLASLDATVIDLIVRMWRLADLLDAERAVGRQMLEAAEAGVVTESDRQKIASLLQVGLYPQRLDESGIAATVGAVEPTLFDGGGDPRSLDTWDGLIRVGHAGRQDGLKQVGDILAEMLREADHDKRGQEAPQ